MYYKVCKENDGAACRRFFRYSQKTSWCGQNDPTPTPTRAKVKMLVRRLTGLTGGRQIPICDMMSECVSVLGYLVGTCMK